MPWDILTAAFVLGFSMWPPLFCVPPLETVIKDSLSITHAQASLLFTGPMVMMVIVTIPAGLVADRIGTRRAAGIGAIILALGAISKGIAGNFYSLLAVSMIFGIGMGAIFPTLPKLVSTWISKESAGVATGIYTVGITLGVALSLAITVPLILPVTGTFRGVFMIWSIPAIVGAILWWILVREPHYETTSGTTKTVPSLREVLMNKGLWLVAFLLFWHNFFFYTWAGWVPLLLTQKGATAELAGLITSVTVWIGIPVVFLMPRLSHAVGLRKPFLWGAGVILGLAAVAAIYFSLPLDWLLMIVAGIANSTRFPIILALPVEMMSHELVGVAGGLILCIGYTGAIVGPLFGGYILDFTGNLELSLVMLVAASLIAVGIAFALPETGARAKRPT